MEALSAKQTLKSDTSMETLAAALLLGVAGDILFWDSGLAGPGLCVWILLLGGASYYFNFNVSKAWRKVLFVWAAVAIAASFLLVLRASMQLTPLVLLVIAMCAVIVLMQAGSTKLTEAKLRDYMRAAWRLPLRVAPGLLPLLSRLQWRGFSNSPRVLGLVKGALLAMPILLVFVALFSTADANYDRYVTSFIDSIGFAAPQHLLLIILVAWFAAGLLRCTQREPLTSTPSPARLFLGGEETLMIMGSLTLLFVSFVVLQASYLFGGQAVIESSTGMTVADYARRGFFELIVIASLTLVVLLCLSSVQCSQRIFRPLAAVLIACVLVILVSALQRLSLYIETFGLSLSRVFAVAFMLWLAGNLLSFAFTSLRGRDRGFASGLVVSGIVTIFLVALINPAAIVVRVNLERSIQTNSQTDWMYLLNLGPDGVPTMLGQLERLPEHVQCNLANGLLMRYSDQLASKPGDWRTWNYSREKAFTVVSEAHAQLFSLSGREQAIANLRPVWPQRLALFSLCS